MHIGVIHIFIFKTLYLNACFVYSERTTIEDCVDSSIFRSSSVLSRFIAGFDL